MTKPVRISMNTAIVPVTFTAVSMTSTMSLMTGNADWSSLSPFSVKYDWAWMVMSSPASFLPFNFKYFVTLNSRFLSSSAKAVLSSV